jgi:hypothetical protein
MIAPAREERRERTQRRLRIWTRRMTAAMLCWTALQAAAAQVVS